MKWNALRSWSARRISSDSTTNSGFLEHLESISVATSTNIACSIADILVTARLKEYQVIGRHLPTDTNPSPALYRMRIFALNEVVAKSRYWYFLRGLKKVKKATGEIVTINEVGYICAGVLVIGPKAHDP
jgi:hypothetical protein